MVNQATQARLAAYRKAEEAEIAKRQAEEADSRLNTTLAVVAQLHGFTGQVQLSSDLKAIEGD